MEVARAENWHKYTCSSVKPSPAHADDTAAAGAATAAAQRSVIAITFCKMISPREMTC